MLQACGLGSSQRPFHQVSELASPRSSQGSVSIERYPTRAKIGRLESRGCCRWLAAPVGRQPRPAPLSHAASERRGNKVKSLTSLEPENQGQNLALTVLCVPYSLNRLLPENQTQNLALTVLSVPYSLHSVAKPVHQGTNKLRQGEKMQLGGRKETESRGGDSKRKSGGGGGGGSDMECSIATAAVSAV